MEYRASLSVGHSFAIIPRLYVLLFSIFITLLLSAVPKREEKKTTSKPKVLSLFDDDDAEEEDWFDAIKPTQT